MDKRSFAYYSTAYDDWTVEKGIFITTSTFTRDAQQEACIAGKKQIDLIDGKEFIDKLIEFRIGVKEKTVFEVDSDFFDKINVEQLEDFIISSRFSKDEILLLLARLIYPSYYFDI